MREAPEIIESNMIACSYRFSWEQFVWAQRSVDAGAVRHEKTLYYMIFDYYTSYFSGIYRKVADTVWGGMYIFFCLRSYYIIL